MALCFKYFPSKYFPSESAQLCRLSCRGVSPEEAGVSVSGRTGRQGGRPAVHREARTELGHQALKGSRPSFRSQPSKAVFSETQEDVARQRARAHLRVPCVQECSLWPERPQRRVDREEGRMTRLVPGNAPLSSARRPPTGGWHSAREGPGQGQALPAARPSRCPSCPSELSSLLRGRRAAPWSAVH